MPPQERERDGAKAVRPWKDNNQSVTLGKTIALVVGNPELGKDGVELDPLVFQGCPTCSYSEADIDFPLLEYATIGHLRCLKWLTTSGVRVFDEDAQTALQPTVTRLEAEAAKRGARIACV